MNLNKLIQHMTIEEKIWQLTQYNGSYFWHLVA